MSGNRHHHSYYDFLLRSTAAARQREDLHPLPSQMLFLWEIYKDNIDPFMKVLHVPTMTKVIRELRGSYHHLGPSMQALVLVISLAAIMSLDDEEVSGSNLKFDMAVRLIQLGQRFMRTSTPTKTNLLLAIDLAPSRRLGKLTF